jgi:hypothetical protein
MRLAKTEFASDISQPGTSRPPKCAVCCHLLNVASHHQKPLSTQGIKLLSYHLEIKETALLLAGLGLDVRIAFLHGPDSFG